MQNWPNTPDWQKTPLHFWIVAVMLAVFGAACAANPKPVTITPSLPKTTVGNQAQQAAALTGAYLSFQHSNFYSLAAPNPATGCAGDANVFYDPLVIADSSNAFAPTPAKLSQSIVDPTTTIRPSFIKNISVDLTDTNAPLAQNQAFACSTGTGATATAASACASFDYGAIDGIPSSLGNTLLMIGGLQSALNPGSNSLSSSTYALAVNSLPASAANGLSDSLAPGLNSADGPISSWANISASSTYNGPAKIAAASMAYSDTIKKLLLFGGISPVSSPNSSTNSSSASDAPTYDTWIFDLKNQTWSNTGAGVQTGPGQLNTLDFNASSSAVFQNANDPGGRALFGYAAVAGSAIAHFSQGGLVAGTQGSGVDTTDRIFIVGGYGPCTGGVCQDTHRFNPTYGPEYIDTQQALNPSDTTAIYTQFPTQWLESYHTRILTNTLADSKYIPSEFPIASPTPDSNTQPSSKNSISFGMTPLNNHFSKTLGGEGLGSSALTQPSAGIVNTAGSSYLAVAGGFYGYASTGNTNILSGSLCSDSSHCGALQIALKWFNPGVSFDQATEFSSSNFSSTTNFFARRGVNNEYREGGRQATPIQWQAVADQGTSNSTPWFGGGVMLKGINLPVEALPSPVPYPSPQPTALPTSLPAEATNQVVFFGGADCRNFLTDSSANCPNWNPIGSTPTGNPGRYWVFGADPAYTFHPGTGAFPVSVTMDGNVPLAAGMAAARGIDASGKPIIVAWGGMISPNSVSKSPDIYYLYYNTTTKKPTWFKVQPTNAGPPAYGNAAMVFSHVTGKFYLFGGYNPVVGTSSDTWELSMIAPTDTSVSCGVSTQASCGFQWKLLSSASGMTCYPSCPQGRRSHRMVEVNYHYFNAPFEPKCDDKSRPCSFGIFMEGGTPNGFTPLFSERWMFDPSANSGAGHWQQMTDLPPRLRSAAATLDYQSTRSGGLTSDGITHRVLLFGGETGMQNPGLSDSKYFVPPTLGDTWMYDFQKNSWNRVRLQGERFHTSAASYFSTLTELEARASQLVTDTSTLEMSPPPIAGGLMVTRTRRKTNHSATETSKALAIPEVFFFGGRKKDGTYQLLNTVFKFCAGTTGEKPYPKSPSGKTVPGPDDASCDAYDATTNPDSPGPSDDYTGRWLKKAPQGTQGADTSQMAAYLGAAVYDTVHDLVVLYGGLTPNSPSYQTAAISDPGNRNTNSVIMEYTPPSAVQNGVNSGEFNGSWRKVPSCAESVEIPEGRYGHSMGFDPTGQSLIIAGGNNSDGNPITQKQTYKDGRTYSIPEVWSARRIDAALPSGLPNQNIPAITSGPFPCYFWSKITVFGNSIDVASQAPPTTGLAESANLFIPSTGYNSGYYTTNDNACSNAGPIYSSDPSISKLLIGGAYIDIDRSSLGANENLILNLTFFPLGTASTGVNQEFLASSEVAYFKVHLVKTGESGDSIRQRTQPRSYTYGATDQYPQVAQSVAVFAPPNGQIRQEQVFLPISIDPSIDRIRIERYSGSAILIDASIFRTGQR